MRTKKALINTIANILSFIIIFIPNLIIRKLFIESLGNDVVGLSSLYSNILSWLSIAEMGIGTAIIYSMYKPFALNDQNKIRAYIQFYGKIYRTVGIVIFIVGVLLCPFLKFFINGEVDFKLVVIGFLMYLTNVFISYLFSHRLCILNVAQNGYIITIWTTISKLIIIVLQIAMFNLYPSFILYIAIQIFINTIYFVGINIYISKKYEWINDGNDRLESTEIKTLTKNIRAMFMHKIGDLVVFSTDNLMISKFIGLTTLTKFTNYQIIIAAVQSLISAGMNGITASIGNMLTEGNKNKAYEIHKKIFFLNFWVVSFVVISLYNTLDQFIGLWIGPNNLLDKMTFIVILINLYITAMRGSVSRFQEGSGTYQQDRYAPICEAIINLVTSLILVKYIGLIGVFIGTLISNFAVIFWTKPYVVYKYVFNKSITKYFTMYFKYLVIAIIPLTLTKLITNSFKYDYTLKSFIINCIINITIINSIYLIIFFRTDEFTYYINKYKNINTKMFWKNK